MLEGEVAVVQKNWSAAATGYRAALQRSQSPQLATRLHTVLSESGKKGEADSFASAWLKDHPKDADFIDYLGALAIARKDYVSAEKHYRAVLQIRPESAIALNNLAWVAGQLHKDGAVDLAEKANQLAPNRPAFMDTLAMLLADKNEFTRAIELQTKALSLQPDNAGARLNLAKIYIKSGDKVRAKAELETLAKLGDRFTGQPEVADLLKTL